MGKGEGSHVRSWYCMLDVAVATDLCSGGQCSDAQKLSQTQCYVLRGNRIASQTGCSSCRDGRTRDI
eukprot:4618022-Pleurochrysis_carterae.AAC.2